MEHFRRDNTELLNKAHSGVGGPGFVLVHNSLVFVAFFKWVRKRVMI